MQIKNACKLFQELSRICSLSHFSCLKKTKTWNTEYTKSFIMNSIQHKTYCIAGESVHICCDDTRFTTCEQLTTVWHPSTTCYLEKTKQSQEKNQTRKTILNAVFIMLQHLVKLILYQSSYEKSCKTPKLKKSKSYDIAALGCICYYLRNRVKTEFYVAWNSQLKSSELVQTSRSSTKIFLAGSYQSVDCYRLCSFS